MTEFFAGQVADDAPVAEAALVEPSPVVLKTDGPTLAEWVAAGYAAEAYPPSGYATREAGSVYLGHVGEPAVEGKDF